MQANAPSPSDPASFGSSPPSQPVEATERTVGLIGAAGIGIGAIVGGGIFVLGGVAVAEAGPSAVVAFALNGCIALLTALVFAELATAFPSNGGQYLYARRAFSVQAAFGVGWVMTFAHVVAAVLYALGFVAYAVAALEALVPALISGIGGDLIQVLTLGIALVATVIYGLVLARGAPGGGQLENVGKLVVFGVLIAAGLAVMVDRGPSEALAPLDPFFEMGAFGFWLVIVAVLLSTLTALRANLLAGSRVALAMARHRTHWWE